MVMFRMRRFFFLGWGRRFVVSFLKLSKKFPQAHLSVDLIFKRERLEYWREKGQNVPLRWHLAFILIKSPYIILNWSASSLCTLLSLLNAHVCVYTHFKPIDRWASNKNSAHALWVWAKPIVIMANSYHSLLFSPTLSMMISQRAIN